MGIFEKWRRKKLSLEEQMRLKFRDEFDDCVKSKTVRSGRTGNSMTDGLLVYSAISITYKTLKDNKQFQALSALTILQHGFDPGQILDEELHRALKKYCGMDSPTPGYGQKDEDDDLFDFDDLEEPETKTKSEEHGIPDETWKHLEDKFGIKKESVEKTMEELNLAPDLSKNNELENKLLAIAKQGASMIQSSFKRFPRGGYAEALIYCSSILVDLGTEHQNEIDLDNFEDRYFLLLHDEVTYNSDVSDAIGFINKRVGFYKEQERKLKASPMFTPMFIYNAFYMHPCCDSPDVLHEFNESPFTLMQMKAVLNETKAMMERKARELGYSLPMDDDFPF